MDGDRRTDMLTATLARSVITFNGQQSRLAPTAPAIGFWPTDISRIVFTTAMFIATLHRAVARAILFLAHEPRLERERVAAILTSKGLALYPAWAIFTAHLLRDESISWTQALAKLIAFFETIAHRWALRLVPLSTALEATKAGSLGAIWFYIEWLAAYFARLFDWHRSPPMILYTNSERLSMGSGSTGVACVSTGRSFVGIELLEEYYEIAQQRIEKAQAEIVQGAFA